MDRDTVFGWLVWFKSCKDLEIFFFVPHMLHDDYYIIYVHLSQSLPRLTTRDTIFSLESSAHALTSIILDRKHNCQNQFTSYFSENVVTIETSY